jgi:DNA-binding NtrC family response regulator
VNEKAAKGGWTTLGVLHQVPREARTNFPLAGEPQVTNADTGTSHAFSGLDGSMSRSEAFDVAARLGNLENTPASPPTPAAFDPALSYGQTRSAFECDFERRYVSWLLERHHGNISAAAREARMDRKHLHDLAKKHGLRGRGTNGRR